jgi:hypothetical protein
MHELRDRNAAAGMDGVDPAAPALDDLGTPALNQVAAAGRRLRAQGAVPPETNIAAPAVGDALPVLGVTVDREAVPVCPLACAVATNRLRRTTDPTSRGAPRGLSMKGYYQPEFKLVKSCAG